MAPRMALRKGKPAMQVIKTIGKTTKGDAVKRRPAATDAPGAVFGANVKALMNKAWVDMTPAEQSRVMKEMGNPSPEAYRKFHKNMGIDQTVPAWFKQRYTDAMSKRHKQGADTGKQKEISNLCKLWFLATRDENSGELTKVTKWHSGWISKSAYAVQEEAYCEKETSYTWGQIVGMHFGEKIAKKALKKGEVVCKSIKGSDGKTYKRYTMKNFEATQTSKRGKAENVGTEPQALSGGDIGRAAALVTGSKCGFGVSDDDDDDSDEWGGIQLGGDSDPDQTDDEDDEETPASGGGGQASTIKNDPELIKKVQAKVTKFIRDLQTAKMQINKALGDKSNEEYASLEKKLKNAPATVVEAIAKFEAVMVKPPAFWKTADLKGLKQDVVDITVKVNKFLKIVSAFTA